MKEKEKNCAKKFQRNSQQAKKQRKGKFVKICVNLKKKKKIVCNLTKRESHIKRINKEKVITTKCPLVQQPHSRLSREHGTDQGKKSRKTLKRGKIN